MSQRRNQGRNKMSGTQWKWKHNAIKPRGHSENFPMRNIYISKGLPKKLGEYKVWLNDIVKNLEKQEQTKPIPSNSI